MLLGNIIPLPTKTSWGNNPTYNNKVYLLDVSALEKFLLEQFDIFVWIEECRGVPEPTQK